MKKGVEKPPQHSSVHANIVDAKALGNALADKRRIWVLTGAGISVASGIPTYRDQSGEWQHSPPIQHGDFVSSSETRKRYWSRSLLGWPTIQQAQPNGSHHVLEQLERNGVIEQLVTQNVDCLHRRAGSNKVIDLHGRLDRVICMDCQHIVWRSDFQVTLQARNPQSINWRAQVLPDGDARLEEDGDSLFEIPTCEKCNGTLIPDVIFYGGHVPKSRVELAYRHLEYADSVLVVGSSLRVYSGFRFIRKAKEIGLPMYAINPGIMRGSEMFDMIVDDEALAVLPTLLEQMSS